MGALADGLQEIVGRPNSSRTLKAGRFIAFTDELGLSGIGRIERLDDTSLYVRLFFHLDQTDELGNQGYGRMEQL